MGQREPADVCGHQGGDCKRSAGRHRFARGGGKTLEDAGAVMGNDLSPQKARILLMLLLQNATKGQKELQAAFNSP
jgi:L-asparaginase/Glu-tRNA(Gln) amidotransferase subunit D